MFNNTGYIVIRDKEKVSRYFEKYPTIYNIVNLIAKDIKVQFKDANIEIYMNEDPEMNCRFPILMVRSSEFSLEFLQKLDEISDNRIGSIGPKDGWFLIMGGPLHGDTRCMSI